MDRNDHKLWLEGINTIEEKEFQYYGEKMIRWIKHQAANQVFIISHDGTITNYRRLLGEEGLTRTDFLGEGGWHQIVL